MTSLVKKCHPESSWTLLSYQLLINSYYLALPLQHPGILVGFIHSLTHSFIYSINMWQTREAGLQEGEDGPVRLTSQYCTLSWALPVSFHSPFPHFPSCHPRQGPSRVAPELDEQPPDTCQLPQVTLPILLFVQLTHKFSSNPLFLTHHSKGPVRLFSQQKKGVAQVVHI